MPQRTNTTTSALSFYPRLAAVERETRYGSVH